MKLAAALAWNHTEPESETNRVLRTALAVSLLLHGLLGVYAPRVPEKVENSQPVETKIRIKSVDHSREQALSVAAPAQDFAVMNRMPPMRAIPQPLLPDRPSRMPVEDAATLSAPVRPSAGATASVARNDAGPPAPPGARQESASPDLAKIIEAFVRRVEEYKEYPYIARKRGQTGTATVRVAIAADGSLSDATLVSSSGVKRLDEAALALVASACPFHHGLGRELRLTVPITYDLKE